MSERAHALLSASGAHRWLACPPSAKLEDQFPESTSAYAEEGSLAHSIAELKLRKQFTEPIGPRKYKAALKELQAHELYQAEMEGYTDAYKDYVTSIVHSFSAPPYVGVEKRLDFSGFVPEGFGTGDCIIIGGDTLYVIDLKYGKGVPVSAEQNPQMMLYALGAYSTYGLLYPITKIHLVVFQPRIDNTSVWEIGLKDLLDWGNQVVKPVAQQAIEGEGEYESGEHCRFCRAKALCRARAAFNVALEPEAGKKPPLIGNSDVGRYLQLGKHIAAWLADLEEYALTTCLAGGEVPGWKAVEGRSIRQWTDSEAAFAALVTAGTDEALLYERKPLTLAAVEKMIGKAAFTEAAGSYVTTPPGKPALVPETDKREAITSRITAQEAFGGGNKE